MRFSPDDRWVAFHPDKAPPHRQIFVAPVASINAGQRSWIPVTGEIGSAVMPRRSPDSGSLYYFGDADGFVA